MKRFNSTSILRNPVISDNYNLLSAITNYNEVRKSLVLNTLTGGDTHITRLDFLMEAVRVAVSGISYVDIIKTSKVLYGESAILSYSRQSAIESATYLRVLLQTLEEMGWTDARLVPGYDIISFTCVNPTIVELYGSYIADVKEQNGVTVVHTPANVYSAGNYFEVRVNIKKFIKYAVLQPILNNEIETQLTVLDYKVLKTTLCNLVFG